MARDLEARIDALYAGPLDAFIEERDGLAKDLAAAGDGEAAARVRALRKPVVAAWALNRLAHEQPEAVRDLASLGERLRAAQRRALSGADVEPLREATEERRRMVTVLVRSASTILGSAGVGASSHRDDLTSTLEAAAADEEAAGLLLSGRLVKPLRPPSGLGEQGLRVLEGGRPSGERARAHAADGEADDGEAARKRAEERRELERGLAAATRREHAAAMALERARRRLAELEERRVRARDALEAAQTEHRGASVEVRRLTAALQKRS